MRVCPKCFGLFADQPTCPQDGQATVHDTEVLVGLHLGPYVVRSMISEGGMGVVYAGEHPTLGRRVALKVLRPELSLRDDIVERFIQEARAVNTIGHANIVNIYDFGRTPFGTFYIVMEYLEGRTLRALLDAAGPQPLERVRFVIEALGAALGAAHAKGFIHRDVKPENVMVGYRGNTEYVKLLDFGIAKLLSSGNTTATSSTMGTPQYMSPEQLDDAKLDHRSDIFALGCVAYELLTGQVPYPGGSQAAVRQAQLTRIPPPPSLCRRDIHLAQAVDHAVLQAVELGSEQRPQQIDEFLAAFRRGYDDSLREQASGRVPGHPKRNWTVFAAAGAFAVVLGTAVALAILLLGGDRRGAKVADAGVTTRPDQRVAPRALTPAEARARALQLVEAALAKHDEAAFHAVGAVGVEALRPRLLAALAADPIPAAKALREMPPTPATSAALRAALKTASSFTAFHLAATLARDGTQRGAALRALATLPTTNNPLLRSHVALELARLDRKRFGKALRKAMSSLMARPWTLAAHAVLGDRKPLREAAVKDLPADRVAAARQLLELDAPPTLAELKRLLDAKFPAAESIAVAGLFADRGDAAAVKTLVDFLDSTEMPSRRLAALELGRLQRLGKLDAKRASSARVRLTATLRDSSPQVVLAAAVALLVF